MSSILQATKIVNHKTRIMYYCFRMDTLGERVEYARGLVDMKPVEFARALKLGRAAISKIEKNQTKTIKLETALAIQNLTGVSASWVLTGKGAIKSTQIRDEQIARIAKKLEGLPDQSRDKIESDVDFLGSLNQ